MGTLTTVFGYCVGVATLAAILALALVRSTLGKTGTFDPLIKSMCRLLPRVFGCRVKVTGRRKIDPTRPYIFMANHVNIFDAPVLYGQIRNFVRGVELEDHFSWPVWGTITARLGTIPISHKNMSRAVKSLRAASQAISEGISILILPEGHRTRDGSLGPFMRGPFLLAMSAGVDIVPIVMKGAFDRKNVHSPVVRPGSVELIFGQPILFQTFGGQTDRALRARVRQAMMGLLGAPGTKRHP